MKSIIVLMNLISPDLIYRENAWLTLIYSDFCLYFRISESTIDRYVPFTMRNEKDIENG